MSRWLWLLALAAGCGRPPGEVDIPEANAEYEALVALGAYRPDAAASLCPRGPENVAAIALRYGVARFTRRPGPRLAELYIEGHPAYPSVDRDHIDRGSVCSGTVVVRFSRQRGQWFLEEAQVTRRGGP